MHMDVESDAFKAILVHVEHNMDWDESDNIQQAMLKANEKRYRLDKKATYETHTVTHKETEALHTTTDKELRDDKKFMGALDDSVKIEIKEFALLKEDVKVLKCGDVQAQKLVNDLRQFAATFAHSSSADCHALSFRKRVLRFRL